MAHIALILMILKETHLLIFQMLFYCNFEYVVVSFLYSALKTIVCLIVFLFLTSALSVFRFLAYECPLLVSSNFC